MQKTQDFNDVICTAAGGVSMRLCYMCCRHDPNDYDVNSKCGIYMSGKLWNRKGALPPQRATGGTAALRKRIGQRLSRNS